MERKIIVQNRPATPEEIPLTKSGYPADLVLRSMRDNRLYKVDPSGAFRRLTPKPSSKKRKQKGRPCMKSTASR